MTGRRTAERTRVALMFENSNFARECCRHPTHPEHHQRRVPAKQRVRVGIVETDPAHVGCAAVQQTTHQHIVCDPRQRHSGEQTVGAGIGLMRLFISGCCRRYRCCGRRCRWHRPGFGVRWRQCIWHDIQSQCVGHIVAIRGSLVFSLLVRNFWIRPRRTIDI